MKKMSNWDESGLDFVFRVTATDKAISTQIRSAKKTTDEKGETYFEGILFPKAIGCFKGDQFYLNPTEKELEEIEVEMKKVEEKKEKEVKCAKILGIIIIFFALVMGIVNIFSDTYIKVVSALPALCFFIGFNMTDVYFFIKRIFGNKDVLLSHRLHGAQHAVINAYVDLKRIPTLDKIKEYSLFSKNCDIHKSISNDWAFLFLAIGLLLANNLISFIIICFIGILVTIWGRKEDFYFFQVFFVSKPTDREYEAAIKCLESALKKKEEAEDVISRVDIPDMSEEEMVSLIVGFEIENSENKSE